MIHRALLLAVAALAALLGSTAAGAQEPSPPVAGTPNGRLDLVDQTLVIGEDSPTFDVRVATNVDQPELFVEIFNAVTTIDDAYDALDGQLASRFAAFPVTVDDLGEPITITVANDEVGESLRARPGVLPVSISLQTNDTVLDQIVTFLVVNDQWDGLTVVNPWPRDDVGVALFGSVRFAPMMQPDGSVVLNDEALDTAESVFGLAPSSSLTVDINTETLRSLSIADPERFAAWADSLSRHDLVRSPWVSIDEEGWRSLNGTEAIEELHRRSTDELDALVDRTATPIAHLDPTANPETLATLRTLGVQAVLVHPEQLRQAGSTPRTMVEIDDVLGVAMPTLAIDDQLSEVLRSDDGELAGFQSLGLLSLLGSAPNEFSILDVAEANALALDVLLAGITDLDHVEATTIAEITSARDFDTDVASARLAPQPATDVEVRISQRRLAEVQASALTSMIDDADTADELSARIDLAASDQLDDETAQAYTDSVGELVNATSEGFEVISEGRTTLAARRAVIPYVIHNDQNIAMTIDVFYSSDKLRFPDGNQRTVTLQPGDNQLGVSVETVGSGDARVLVDLASPDGLLELGSGSIAIRSTAISGLGLVIGAIALLVLGAWWIRTIVRVRRARKGATVAGDANVDHDDVDSADTDSPNTIDADPQGDP